MHSYNYFHIQIEYDDRDKALYDVRENKVWGLLSFPHNFTRSLAHKVTEGVDADNEYLAQSFIETWVDLSSKCKNYKFFFKILLLERKKLRILFSNIKST